MSDDAYTFAGLLNDDEIKQFAHGITYQFSFENVPITATNHNVLASKHLFKQETLCEQLLRQTKMSLMDKTTLNNLYDTTQTARRVI